MSRPREGTGGTSRGPREERRPAERATKNDVELAKQEVELAKVQRSFEVRGRLAQGASMAMQIAAASIPIWATQALIEPLAGQKTVVEANIALGGGLALSVTINIVQYAKGRGRKSEMERERQRADDLERKLLE